MNVHCALCNTVLKEARGKCTATKKHASSEACLKSHAAVRAPLKQKEPLAKQFDRIKVNSAPARRVVEVSAAPRMRLC